jgi:CHASE2 domain-containing sensor protein
MNHVVVRKIASVLFVIDAVAIGLGSVGHGFAVRHVHAAIDNFPIEPDIHSMIYVVWYFVSGCMFAFGTTLIWVWLRLRRGDSRPLVAAMFIGVLYVGIGVFGFIYRGNDPFMAMFVVLGSVVLISGPAMVRGANQKSEV